MEKKVSLVGILSGIVVAFALFVVGCFFILLGISFLPIIGIVGGLAIMWVSLLFFRHIIAEGRDWKIVHSERHTSSALATLSQADRVVLTAE